MCFDDYRSDNSARCHDSQTLNPSKVWPGLILDQPEPWAAALAVHDKKAQDEAFLQFFPLIKQYAGDERNFVKKAVNWALRQIGKRNSNLHALALDCAYEILDSDSKTARWVAKDALKELQAKEFKN